MKLRGGTNVMSDSFESNPVSPNLLRIAGVDTEVLVEDGVVYIPGTHVVNQGREVKPKTGTSRPGDTSRETTPSWGHNKVVFPKVVFPNCPCSKKHIF